MPVTIGGKRASDFTDPIGVLSDCHRRIERFLGVLLAVATRAHGGPLAGDHRVAFETALRYFREAAPKHTADEEESLFPRLRRLSDPAVREADSHLDSLREDHIRAEIIHQEVDRLGNVWLHQGRLTPEDASRLKVLLAGLRDIYQGHIAIEDHRVFPLAQQLLAKEQLAVIGREMASRRGISYSGSAPRPD